MAIIKIRNTAIDLDAAEIPNIDASKITSGTISSSRISGLPASSISSGTFADARIAASNVSQHASSFDDNKIVNDISTLAIRQASDGNKSAYNTNSQFVDVFQDDTGIDTETNTDRNASEYISSIISGGETYETGDRSSSITITSSNITVLGGSLSLLVNGNTTGDSSNGFYWSGTGNSSSNSVTFDFGSGNAKIISGVKWYQHDNTNHGNWSWQGSNDNSTYTNLSGTIVLGTNTTNEYTWSNLTSYRYIKLVGVDGSRQSSSWNTEVEFRVLSLNNNATGNFTSNNITALSSVSSMGAIITYQDQAGTNALNTDIVLQLSADGGSNFTTATMTALPDFSTGIKMAKVNDLAVTAGTSLKYKISFANQSASKDARIRGVSLQY